MPHTYCSIALRDQPEQGIVLWKEVEEGWIRFDSLSGATHLLSHLARFVVELIEESPIPLSSSDIVAKVLFVEPDAEPEQTLVEVSSTLQILSEAQLVEIHRLDRQRPDSV